jgi:glycosyltransferase involved in cell wall biosynthesis
MPLTTTGPFVSIITVSLNAADTIGDTLASVARQAGGVEVEHVCVDGGSRDATRAIIDAAAAESGRILRVYEPDRGIYDAMNKGWRAAGGEYILYLNADDFLCAPDILSCCLQGLQRGAAANPDLIVGDVAMGALGATGVWRHRRVPRLLTARARSGLFPVHQGRLVQRHLIEQVGGFDAGMRLASDVTQFYDMQRLRPLSMRRVPRDLAFMRAGGAANGSLAAMWLGTRELYGHLRATDSALRAGAMTLMKTVQSLSEVRYGRCPHARWFAA